MRTMCLVLLSACAPAALSAGQRMELIERLDQSAAFAKECGLGRSEMRVRFAALPDGTISEPVVVMGEKGTPEKAACVLSRMQKARVSPHESGLTVRTERLLPTGRVQTDAKLLADENGLSKAYIDKIVTGGDAAVKACAAKSAVKGAATVFFLVSPEGTVSDVLVESKLGAAEVEWCVLDVFRTLRFDRPAGGGYVEVVREVRL